MKKVKNDRGTIERPAIEVTIRVHGQERALVAFFEAEHGGWDVLVALDDPKQRANVVSAFRQSASAMAEASFGAGDPTAPGVSDKLPWANWHDVPES